MLWFYLCYKFMSKVQISKVVVSFFRPAGVVSLPFVVELLKFLPAKYVTYLCCQYPHLKWLSSQLFSPDFLHFSVVIGQELVQFLVQSLSVGRNSYWTSLDQDPSDHQKCPLLLDQDAGKVPTRDNWMNRAPPDYKSLQSQSPSVPRVSAKDIPARFPSQ